MAVASLSEFDTVRTVLRRGPARLLGADGTVISLPAEAQALLGQVVDGLRTGREVSVAQCDSPRRTELTGLAQLVSRSPLHQIENETGYQLALGSSQPAFLVLTTPQPAGIAEPNDVVAKLAQASRENRSLFQIGRAIVLAFHGPWKAAGLVDDLRVFLVRFQLGYPIPTLRPRSATDRALQTLRSWIRSLSPGTAMSEGTDRSTLVRLPVSLGAAPEDAISETETVVVAGRDAS